MTVLVQPKRIDRSLVNGVGRGFLNGVLGNAGGIPTVGLIFKAMYPGMVNTIGLSISEFWAACPVEHRALYSADGSVFYDSATIITNIEASEYLNDAELIGREDVGYVQYADGTSRDILNRAVKYFYRYALFVDNEPLIVDGEILEVV